MCLTPKIVFLGVNRKKFLLQLHRAETLLKLSLNIMTIEFIYDLALLTWTIGKTSSINQ